MQILRDHCRSAWLRPQSRSWLRSTKALGSGKDFPLIAVSEAFENMTGFKRILAFAPGDLHLPLACHCFSSPEE